MPRPKGLPKTEGRKKGSKNKVTREIELARSGMLPLDYMLKVMRDPKTKQELRMEMAKAAARYIHPRQRAGAPIQKSETAERTLKLSCKASRR